MGKVVWAVPFLRTVVEWSPILEPPTTPKANQSWFRSNARRLSGLCIPEAG